MVVKLSSIRRADNLKLNPSTSEPAPGLTGLMVASAFPSWIELLDTHTVERQFDCLRTDVIRLAVTWQEKGLVVRRSAWAGSKVGSRMSKVS